MAPDVPVRILRLAALVKLKKEAGRAQDLADMEELRLIHGELGDA